MKVKLYLKFLIIYIIAFSAMRLFAASTNVRLNSLGFLPNNDKIATINGTCTAFTIIRVSDGSVRYSGTVTGPLTDAQTGESTLYKADFSTLTEAGTFYMNVSNGAANFGTSINFAIDPNTYNAPFVPIFKGMYMWRCGTAVSETYSGTTWSHAACHTQDAWEDEVGGGHVQKASTQGWHDAGDYNKYVVNAGITLGMLFMAWEQFGSRINSLAYGLPVTAPGYPEFLEEIKWETDWLLTMQMADGEVYDKVSELAFCAFIQPEANTVNRYFAPTGTIETATFCAMMAMSARIFQPYDAAYSTTCLNAATAAYNHLTANGTNVTANLTAFSTGNYATSNANAGRLWAAAEMWETTGSAAALSDFETRANAYSPAYVDVNFDWGNIKNLGMYTYVMSSRTGRNAALLANIKANITTDANNIVTTRNGHPYGRPLGATYEWGCNGEVARQAMLLQIANQITPTSSYLNTALDAIGYLFGRNTHDRSYVTGVGINPPLHPHHRPSESDGIAPPYPGYLVGGSPGNNQQDPVLTLTPSGLPIADYWSDSVWSYSSNEIAINWQGALIYAISGFLGVSGTPTFTPTWTLTATPTLTNAPTHTFTQTFSRTATATYTSTPTGTNTRTSTATASNTGTPTNSPTLTLTSSPSASPSLTRTGTPTSTATASSTPSRTATSTNTPTPSESVTASSSGTYTRSATSTFTGTRTSTPNFTMTLTQTPTQSASPTFTITETDSVSPSATASVSPTIVLTYTNTPTITDTATGTPPTPTVTPTVTATYTVTATGTPTFTCTDTPTGSPTATLSVTMTSTASDTESMTASPTLTASITLTPTFTVSFTLTLTLTSTRTYTQTPAIPSPTASSTPASAPAYGPPAILDQVIYPNPYDPDSGRSLNLRFIITREAVKIRLKIYTAGFRSIKEIDWPGDFPAGEVDRSVVGGNMGNLANGTYYYLIIADMKQGGTIKSKPDMLIILR